MREPKKILFLTLHVFGATGGIEKVCRIAAKSLYEMSFSEMLKVKLMSMHDTQEQGDENRFFPTESFHGFGGSRMRFISSAVKEGAESDIVILSHINLLLAGWLIKKISPRTKVVMFAHGIEVWRNLQRHQLMMIASCDRIFAVSNYTAEIVSKIKGIKPGKTYVLNNCLDPFLPQKTRGIKNAELRHRYDLKETDQVLFTLTRLSSKERYKGYDKVIEAMMKINQDFPNLKYLIAGSYDATEKSFLNEMISKYELDGKVKLAGFIPEEELIDHFKMADLYVMPSMKEGFGIVFIEAMFYGLPVIAGNKDGSTDALLNGELGKLVDPLNTSEIANAVSEILKNRNYFIPDRNLLLSSFGYDAYKEKFKALLDSTLAEK